jgi:hypothetical protein
VDEEEPEMTMDPTLPVSSRDLSGAAPTVFQNILSTLANDNRLGLHYSLLRLELAGLTERDQTELLELGRCAMNGFDVTSAVQSIVAREDASPLAATIARIVDHGQGGDRRRALMLGAVVGAHAFGFVQGLVADDFATQLAVVGAVAGGAAVAHLPAVEEIVTRSAWDAFTSTTQ